MRWNIARQTESHDLIIVDDDLENAYKELEEFMFTPRSQEQGAKDESKIGVSCSGLRKEDQALMLEGKICEWLGTLEETLIA